MPPSPDPAAPRDRETLYSTLAAALALFAAEGFAVALGSWALLHREGLSELVISNRIEPASRSLLVGLTSGCGVLAASIAWLFWFRGRIASARLASLAKRLTPLLPLAVVPFFAHWRVWDGRTLPFLLGVAAIGLGLRWSVGVALRPAASGGAPRAAAGSGAAAALGRRSWPALVVLLAALGYALYFSLITVRAHHYGYTRSFDLGIFDNLHWNLVHGGSFLQSTPASVGGGSHLGRHATFFAYLLAPIYAVYQRAETLLVIQSTLLGAAALPLYHLARRFVRPGTSVAIALLYLLYAPLHGSNLYDFHFLTLSPLFVFWTAWAVEAGRNRHVVVAVLLTLSLREDVALSLAVVGLWQLFCRRRARLGALLTLIGVGYFVLMKSVVMPLAGGDVSYSALYYGELLPGGTGGAGGLVATLLSNPTFAFTTLIGERKLIYLLEILAPLLFLPLRRPIGALFLLPGFLFTLLSTGYEPLVRTSFQYTAYWTPFVFLAVLWNLSGAGGRPGSRADDPVRARAWLAALVVAGLLCSYQLGAVLQRNTARAGLGPPGFLKVTVEDRLRRVDREELLARLPARARVAASESVVPHVSNRPYAYTLRQGVRDAEYVVVGVRMEASGEHAEVLPALLSGELGVVADNAHYVLLQRGAPTSRNREIVRRLAPASR